MTTRYATMAYGPNETVHRQAAMLMISLLAYAPDPRELIVLTDHPEAFGGFFRSKAEATLDVARDLVDVRRLNAEQLAAWRGTNPFSMRQKLEAAHALAQNDRALVLLDADTLAIADLGPFVRALGGGALFMHKREFELGTSRRRGNRRLWEELRDRSFAGWRFQPDDAMWNSGALAFRGADVNLISQALRLYDAMGQAGIRYFATEQLVAGLVFGRTGRLAEAREWFTHYWGNKEEFDREIQRRLDDARRRGVSPFEVAEELRRAPIALPAERRPGRLAKLRRWLSR